MTKKKVFGRLTQLGKFSEVVVEDDYYSFVDDDGVCRELQDHQIMHDEWLLLCRDRRGNHSSEFFNGNIYELYEYMESLANGYEIYNIGMFYRD